MSQSIQIYNGHGANNVSVQAWKRELREGTDGRFYKIEEFNSSYSAGFDRGNVALVILPDGSACEMFEPLLNLADKVKQAIGGESSAIISGASAFLTSCQAQDVFNFNPLSVCKSTLSENTGKELKVKWMSSKGHYQSDMCTLYRASESSYLFEKIYPKVSYDCRVLAEYEAISFNAHIPAAAILYQPFQSTPRLITGLHPEIGIEDLNSLEFELHENLKDSEILRKQMCRSWFSELGLKITP